MFLYAGFRDWRDRRRFRALLDIVGHGLLMQLSTIIPKVSYISKIQVTHSPFTRVGNVTLIWGDPTGRTDPILRWRRIEAVVGASGPIFVEMGPVKGD